MTRKLETRLERLEQQREQSQASMRLVICEGDETEQQAIARVGAKEGGCIVVHFVGVESKAAVR